MYSMNTIHMNCLCAIAGKSYSTTSSVLLSCFHCFQLEAVGGRRQMVGQHVNHIARNNLTILTTSSARTS